MVAFLRRGSRTLALGLVAVSVGLVAACSGSPGSPASPAAPGSPTTVAEPTGQAAAAAPGDPVSGPCELPVEGELRGTGSLWALVFRLSDHPDPVSANVEVKIVFKMAGTGTVEMSGSGPDGAVAKLAWGPTGHGGSSWERPGGEWGTGWVFSKPGCWTLTASRSTGERETLGLRVGPA